MRRYHFTQKVLLKKFNIFWTCKLEIFQLDLISLIELQDANYCTQFNQKSKIPKFNKKKFTWKNFQSHFQVECSHSYNDTTTSLNEEKYKITENPNEIFNEDWKRLETLTLKGAPNNTGNKCIITHIFVV